MTNAMIALQQIPTRTGLGISHIEDLSDMLLFSHGEYKFGVKEKDGELKVIEFTKNGVEFTVPAMYLQSCLELSKTVKVLSQEE